MRLIDADAIPFRDELKRLSVLDHDKYITARTLEYMLEHAPTVEAVPVVHGHWIKDSLVSTGGGTYGVRRCSACEWYCEDNAYKFNYCPRCGAKMDEVTE